MRIDPTDPIRSWWEVADEERGKTGMSLDDLAFEARSYGGKGTITGSVISQIKNQKRPYSTAFFESIAGALNISPFRFGEYHLALARDLIDERQVGLETALGNLDHLPELVAEASESWPAGSQLLRETESQISRALDPPNGESAETGTEARGARAKRGRA